MSSSDTQTTNRTWELSLYELNRTPQEVITDSTEIAVSPRSLHSELMCPICLDMLKNTMTTKECLHRFCQECIITALRSGNKVTVRTRAEPPAADAVFHPNPAHRAARVVRSKQSTAGCPACAKQLQVLRSPCNDATFATVLEVAVAK
ncbi:hypothetical protein HPB48_018698 [Haemaphysalis longicornis]|uniref:RING-type E3 ubiquitin transferase n=1 Tax=Haemaphysalis longicornis TaxID=44386 RepID=A0A9J6GUQ1_HAELO|nr:hypothetical protein HPB48_018698 [Haemaphysalis longicornis]